MSSNDKFTVKIIRLKTGEDIIGFIYQDTEKQIYEVRYPKTFYFNVLEDHDELVILDWMPRAAFGYQEVELKGSDVLFTNYPTYDFGFEYLRLLLDHLDESSSLYARIKETITEDEPEITLELPKILH